MGMELASVLSKNEEIFILQEIDHDTATSVDVWIGFRKNSKFATSVNVWIVFRKTLSKLATPVNVWIGFRKNSQFATSVSVWIGFRKTSTNSELL